MRVSQAPHTRDDRTEQVAEQGGPGGAPSLPIMKIPADPVGPKVSNGDGWEYEISDLQDSSTGSHLDLFQLLFPRFRPLQQRREI